MDAPSRHPVENLEQAAGFLDGLINRERRIDYSYVRLGLDPIRALLDRLERPEEALSIVHVAGSKGKGSTCLFAEAILSAAGESVGTFTSPHLESWLERFRIGGAPVEATRLVAAVERIRRHVEALRVGPAETVPSFFDATTAVALLLFAEAGVDRALLEVGLGGRLDSTNVVRPRVTCITSIELEHTDKLGGTEAAIAFEKAGIVKPGVPLVLGALGAEADAVVRTQARALGAPLRALGEAFFVEAGPQRSRQGGEWRYVEPGGFEIRAHLATPGAPARSNAALALGCVRALEAHSAEVLARTVPTVLAGLRLPGRIERLEGDPEVVVDSAHTGRSAEALAEALASLAPAGVDLVLSVSGDKDLDALLAALIPRARRIWATCAEPVRSLSAEDLARRVRERAPQLAVEAIEDPESALLRARASLPAGRLLCATGSIYLAGIARRVLARAFDRTTGIAGPGAIGPHTTG